MISADQDLTADVEAVGRIDAVPTILEVLCRITGMGFAAVARVTQTRWIACAVRDEINFGLKAGGELQVETTICDEIRAKGEGVIIDNVAEDSAYCGHPTPAMYGFQSYISIPIWRADRGFFGTLCAIDPKPARVSRPEIIAMFELFAKLIANELAAQERYAVSEAALVDERKVGELRDQFIAVLGHDLRNPLASIDAGIKTLARDKPSPKTQTVLTLMQKSVGRMSEMIENVLDLARGQLGGGAVATRADHPDLATDLKKVVDELHATAPDRAIETAFAISAPVAVDRWRLERLLSNLLGNALAYGAPDKPIRVRAFTDADGFELSVANQGAPIPPDVAKRIFQPFFRAPGATNQGGLGLGLYIVSQIARAHGGTLTVASDDSETRFTFRMPLR